MKRYELHTSRSETISEQQQSSPLHAAKGVPCASKSEAKQQ